VLAWQTLKIDLPVAAIRQERPDDDGKLYRVTARSC
jgi:hypothetical protein